MASLYKTSFTVQARFTAPSASSETFRSGEAGTSEAVMRSPGDTRNGDVRLIRKAVRGAIEETGFDEDEWLNARGGVGGMIDLPEPREYDDEYNSI